MDADAHASFTPRLVWNPSVFDYLSQAYGPAHFAHISDALTSVPLSLALFTIRSDGFLWRRKSLMCFSCDAIQPSQLENSIFLQESSDLRFYRKDKEHRPRGLGFRIYGQCDQPPVLSYQIWLIVTEFHFTFC